VEGDMEGSQEVREGVGESAGVSEDDVDMHGRSASCVLHNK